MLLWKSITVKFFLNKTESASLNSHVVFKTVLTLLFFSPQSKMEGGTQTTDVLEKLKFSVVVQVLLSAQQISHEYVTSHESWMPNN